jgi:CelD/BcsL family acetyltransferase involved in cellulose biosynthesis
MRVHLTDDPSAFRRLDWSEVVRLDPEGTVFHTPAYLKLWWEEFASGELRIAVALDDGGEIVGACGFELADGQLRFLGGFDVTDYQGPVSLPEARDEVAAGILASVEALAWEGADLRGIPAGSAWASALERAAAGRGWTLERAEDGVAPLIELPASFEAYLAGLPAKLRHEIRRKERRLIEQVGAPTVRFGRPATASKDMDRFLGLHRESPGPKGRFMQPGMEIFFRRLTESLLPAHVFHLAFLEVRGTVAAAAVGFGFKDTFSLYNSAFDREFGAVAPGMVLVADLLRRAADQGRRRFDLLKGDLPYKYRFGATPRRILRLVVRR